MSGEIPLHQPNPSEFDPNKMANTEAMDIHADQEALQNETRQLAGNVIKLIESGDPNMLKEYFNDVLADTENLVPASERMAVFRFLANEQRSEIRRGLVVSGEQMLDNLDNNNDKFGRDLQKTASQANRSMHMVLQTHEQEVGRYFRGQVDTRRAARAHEATEQVAFRSFGVVTNHVERLGDWARAQNKEARAYSDEVLHGQHHERALIEASEVVEPDYEGKQKDISYVIDEGVKEASAAKLKSVIAEAQASGGSPEDAVMELLGHELESAMLTSTSNLVEELHLFVDKYAQLAKKGSLKVEHMTDDSRSLLKRFGARGRNEYQSVRRIEEAVGVYRQQKRAVEDVVKGVDSVMRQSRAVTSKGDQEIRQIRQKVMAVKAAQAQ